jgi:hypothetical protein
LIVARLNSAKERAKNGLHDIVGIKPHSKIRRHVAPRQMLDSLGIAAEERSCGVLLARLEPPQERTIGIEPAAIYGRLAR